ncbi:hypothetical protein F2P81_024898 [Scophthalmus maximus]|uniref:Uncharacterized protein n=1 Tax=Scophthalmus maximus TaxID=52904 RepID=A0A6A4RRJ1_SCOMX|nr:hypothetical protein F2P81_024898 [Scophthalmus maximus]
MENHHNNSTPRLLFPSTISYVVPERHTSIGPDCKLGLASLCYATVAPASGRNCWSADVNIHLVQPVSVRRHRSFTEGEATETLMM